MNTIARNAAKKAPPATRAGGTATIRQWGKTLDRLVRSLRALERCAERDGDGAAVPDDFRALRAHLQCAIRIDFPKLLAVGRKGGGAARLIAVAVEYATGRMSAFDMRSFCSHLRDHACLASFSSAEIAAAPAALRIAYLLDFQSQAAACSEMGALADERAMQLRRCLDGLDVSVENDLIATLDGNHALLSRDPAGLYPRMTPVSQLAYRQAAEDLAATMALGSDEVCERALRLAFANRNADPRAAHVGYYLTDEGRDELGASVACRAVARRERRMLHLYRGLTVAIVVSAAGAGTYAIASSVSGFVAVLIGVCFAIAIAPFAVATAEALMKPALDARRLPALAPDRTLTADGRSALCIPVLVSSVAHVQRIGAALRRNAAALDDPGIPVILLTDFADSDTREDGRDQPLLQALSQMVAALNRCAEETALPRYHLLHRGRSFVATQGRWLGRERKRGKLEDLHSLLLRGDNAFSLELGDAARLRNVARLMVIDEDTVVGHGCYHELLGALLHPLNQPRVDPATSRVVRGHGLFVPTIDTVAAHRMSSWFKKYVFGFQGLPATSGVDFALNTLDGMRTVRVATANAGSVWRDLLGLACEITEAGPNDAFQFDLRNERAFTGKGMYTVEIFDRLTNGRIPEQRILSHDIIEGAWLRPGQVHDARIEENSPPTYRAWCRRQHRWMRGDWQNLAALTRGAVEDATHGIAHVPTFTWRVVAGQCLRHLAPMAMLVAIVACLAAGMEAVRWILLCFIAVSLLPALSAGATSLVERSRIASPVAALFDGRLGIAWACYRSLLGLALLPQQAYLNIDALLRTAVRSVTGKHLLAWTTSAQVESQQEKDREAGLPLSVAAPAVFLLLLAWVAASVSARGAADETGHAQPRAGLATPVSEKPGP